MTTETKTSSKVPQADPDRVSVVWLPLNQLNFDRDHYQRPFDPQRVRPGGDLYPFNPEAFGVGAVSQRDDGTFWGIDAQHRTMGGIAAGYDDQEFPFLVYTGLSIEQEASRFTDFNRFKNLTPVARFQARVTAADPVATTLNKIVVDYGWRVGTGRVNGVFSAVSALEKVYLHRAFDEPQESACRDTIEMVTNAWGHDPDATHKSIVSGLGLLMLRHRDAADKGKLIRELAQLSGGPLGLLARGRTMRDLRAGDLGNAIADVLTNLNNKGRRTNVLPAWTALKP